MRAGIGLVETGRGLLALRGRCGLNVDVLRLRPPDQYRLKANIINLGSGYMLTDESGKSKLLACQTEERQNDPECHHA